MIEPFMKEKDSSMEQDKPRAAARPVMADRADPHVLYQKSVQSPDHDVPLLVSYFEDYTGQPLRLLREDFCGTAAFAAYFVTRHSENRAVGIDLDEATLQWGIAHNASGLTADQQQRLTLIQGNVLDVHPPEVQLTVAMNFSYMAFKDRPTLLRYFKRTKASLRPGGMFVLDIWGGSESQVLLEETREIENPDDDGIGDFTFVWDQDAFDPATYFCTARIHFAFRDKSELRNAFVYDWRMWTLPDVMELMKEAGFHDVHFLWEGTDPETGDGTGTYHRVENGEADLSWIAYIAGINPGTRP